jgi:tetratricopeptide (TPR) repeat protein
LSDKKPFRYWPLVFVGVLAVALLLSNGTARLPNGDEAIISAAQYDQVAKEVRELTLESIEKTEKGENLSENELSHLRKASRLIDRMNKFEPTLSTNHFLQGKIHLLLNEPTLAEDEFKQCVLLAPGNASARPTDAQAIQATAAEAHYQLSQLLLARNHKDLAFQAANEAVKIVPQSSNYWTARASALNELRKAAEAKKDLQTALKLDPNNARAKSLLSFISK